MDQVGAQTGHKVTLVDVSQDVLDKSNARIGESIKRVAKKKFKEDPAAGQSPIYICHLSTGIGTDRYREILHK